MSIEQLVLVLPKAEFLTGQEMTIHHWTIVLEQFTAQGGREVLLGGTPLAYPGFWPLVRRCLKAGVPRSTVYLTGSLLEPWVLRELVESGVHVLIGLDSIDSDVHDGLYGVGSHARAMAAIETFLRQGLAQRVGILATATRLGYLGLPMLAAWAGGRGVARFLWTTVPDGGWPSPQLRSLRLSPEEKSSLSRQMEIASRSLAQSLYVGPLDPVEDSELTGSYSRLLRVDAYGEVSRGFSGEGARLGNLETALLQDLLARFAQEAGD